MCHADKMLCWEPRVRGAAVWSLVCKCEVQIEGGKERIGGLLRFLCLNLTPGKVTRRSRLQVASGYIVTQPRAI